MHIAIIGTGRMGLNLGKGWAKAGHTIIFGSRNPDAKADFTTKVKGCKVTTPSAALVDVEAVVLTLPYPQVKAFAQDHAAQLRDRLVIDISNPFDNLPDNRMAGAEITAQAIGSEARVVAAFKDNFSETLLDPVDAGGLKRDVHFAGDNEADKQIVTQLIEDLGFRPVDCGSLRNARLLDGMVPLIVELDRRYRGGAHKSSWKLLS